MKVDKLQKIGNEIISVLLFLNLAVMFTLGIILSRPL